MTVDLDRLEALARAATPGEWKTECLTGGGHHNVGVRVSGSLVCGYTAVINTRWPNPEQAAEQEANAEFIAATNPDTVLKLIAQARAQQAGAAPIALADAIQYLQNVAADAVPMLSHDWPKTSDLLKGAVAALAHQSSQLRAPAVAADDRTLPNLAILHDGIWYVPMHLVAAVAPSEAKGKADDTQEPVAWLRFWAAQYSMGEGNIGVDEGLEVCNEGDIGMDGRPAFPVYATPCDAKGKADAANAGRLSVLPGCLADRLYEAIDIARDRAEHAGSTPRIRKWEATAADLRAALSESPATSAADAKDAEITDEWIDQIIAQCWDAETRIQQHIRKVVRAAIAAQQAAPVAKGEQSDLTTIQCPACVALPGLGCDECHGQGRIIVSRADLAAQQAQSSAKGGDAAGGQS